MTAAAAGVSVVAAPGSLGIHKYGAELVGALQRRGIDATLFGRAPGRERLHLQLGNSSRSVIPAVVRGRRPTVVTLHDVLPRDPRLRRAWRAALPRLLGSTHVVVHSDHAATLARGLGVTAPLSVIGLGVEVSRIAEADRAAIRGRIAPDGRPIALSAGVLKRAKGTLEVLDQASRHPQVVFAFAGSAADDAVAAALRDAPENVVHLDGLDDRAFVSTLAACDVLLTPRRDWVGEASGPVARAHGVGTPVAGYALGGLPEYCGDEDLLLPGSAGIGELIELVVQKLQQGMARLPINARQVTTWEDSARSHAELYAQLGWCPAVDERRTAQ